MTPPKAIALSLAALTIVLCIAAWEPLPVLFWVAVGAAGQAMLSSLLRRIGE